ncbi:MAG: hypothetical protein LQ352_004284 [Teloschistes flavicans]|nr:MAG: hypothetical protein LQ352_004284 [Teloschistes flavicans]
MHFSTACQAILQILTFMYVSVVLGLPKTRGNSLSNKREVGPPTYETPGMLYLLDFSSHRLSFARENDENLKKAIQLQRIMEGLVLSLIPALNELKGKNPISTSDPSPAYRTFFKETRNRNYIRNLLIKVGRGAPVYSPTFPPHDWQRISPEGNPVIISITERGQLGAEFSGETVDMYDWCDRSPAVILKNSTAPNPFVVLCPYFWTARPPYVKGDLAVASHDGQPASNCLSVNSRTNKFRKLTPPGLPAGFELTQYRQWILLHLLAALYRFADTGDMVEPVQDVNAVWRLNALEALGNGHSYLYYVASVYGNCTDFPHLTHGDEFLEVSDLDDPYDFGLPYNAALVESLNITNVEFPAGTPLNITLGH